MVLCSLLTAEQPRSAAQIVEFVHNSLNRLKSVSATVDLTTTLMDTEVVLSGNMIRKQPHLLRVNLAMTDDANNYDYLLVVDQDQVLWQENKVHSFKQITRLNLADQLTSGASLVHQINPAERWRFFLSVMDLTALADEKIRDEDVCVIEGTWNQRAVQDPQLKPVLHLFGNTRFYFGSKDGFPRKVVTYDKTNKTVVMSVEFSNIVFNPEMADEIFIYRPPMNINVRNIDPPALSVPSPQQP